MRVRLARVRPLIVVVLVAGVAATVGCGGDGGGGAAAERERLVDSLGFLATDLGLSDDEVACTAEQIEQGLEGEDLDDVAAAVRRVDAGDVGLDELPGDVADAITGAVAACAGAS